MELSCSFKGFDLPVLNLSIGYYKLTHCNGFLFAPILMALITLPLLLHVTLTHAQVTLSISLILMLPILYALFVILHEMGHYWAGRWTGLDITFCQVSLWLFTLLYIPANTEKRGILGIIKYDQSKLFDSMGCVSYTDPINVLSTVAGPFANLILMLLFILGCTLINPTSFLYDLFAVSAVLNGWIFLVSLESDGVDVYELLRDS